MENKNTKLNKIEYAWTIICENSTVDSQTNNMSLFNLIEKVIVQGTDPLSQKNLVVDGLKKTPFLNFPLKIVSLWKRADISDNDEINFDAKVEIFDPKGKLIGDLKYQLPFKPGVKRIRGNFDLKGIPLVEYGEYRFDVLCKDSDVNSKYKKFGSTSIEITKS